MLFKRRKTPHLARQVLRSVWPKAGWKRTFRYVLHRVRRFPGTPHAVAAGFAAGAAVSMLPFPGLHFVLGALLAWAFRSSILASMVGTFVGNPWTFPLIWIWTFRFGNWILGVRGGDSVGPVTLAHLFEKPWEILFPMVVGGVPTAIATWIVIYFPVRRMVASYQARRRGRLERATAVTVQRTAESD